MVTFIFGSSNAKAQANFFAALRSMFRQTFSLDMVKKCFGKNKICEVS